MSKQRKGQQHHMLRTYLLIFVIVTPACTPAALQCGESFCVRSITSPLTKRSPVEDFNVYDVRYHDRSFLIYEGNHPGKVGTPIRKIELDASFGDAEIFASEAGKSVRITTEISPWPEYVVISSSNATGVELEAFAKLFVRRGR